MHEKPRRVIPLKKVGARHAHWCQLKAFSFPGRWEIPSPHRGEGQGEGRQKNLFPSIPLILTFSPRGGRDRKASIDS
jgi:hypothetical protein